MSIEVNLLSNADFKNWIKKYSSESESVVKNTVVPKYLEAIKDNPREYIWISAMSVVDQLLWEIHERVPWDATVEKFKGFEEVVRDVVAGQETIHEDDILGDE